MEVDGLERIIHHEKVPRSPREHLALNLMSARLVADGRYDVFARVYRHSPGVILGESQSIEDIRADVAQELGYEIARRPTGGSAVIVSPEQALCYSLFFKIGSDRLDVTRLYRESVIPFARELGEGVVVEGSYYLRHGSEQPPPFAGHAMKLHHHNSVVQVDGIFHDADVDTDLFARILRLRDLYACGDEKVMRVDDAYLSLDGKPIQIAADAQLSLERSELDELRRSKGMGSVGISEDSIVDALSRSIASRFGSPRLTNEFEYPLELEPYLAQVDRTLGDGYGLGQGHCFVDLQEPEPRFRD